MSNNTTSSTGKDDFAEVFTVAKILVLIVTILGNVFVILTIRRFKRMRTALNYLIMNLSICDIMIVTFSIPPSIILQQNKSRGYMFGAVGCKLLWPLATLATNSAVFSLLCITVERYMAIKNPLKWGYRKRYVKIFICLTYTCAMASVLPYAVFLKYEINDKGIPVCKETWSDMSIKSYTMVLFLLQYGVPLPVMFVLYMKAWISLKRNNDEAIKLSNEQRNSRTMSIISEGQLQELEKKHRKATQRGFRKVISHLWKSMFESRILQKCKRKGIKTDIEIIVEDVEEEIDLAQSRRQQNIRTFIMFIVIILLFAVCSLPNQIIWLYVSFFQSQSEQLSSIIIELFLLLHYSHCVFNPWIYGGLNRTFRKGYKKIITCKNSRKESSTTNRDSLFLLTPGDNDLFKNGIITQRPVGFIECGSIESILKEPVEDEWNHGKKNSRVKFKLSLASFTSRGSHEKEMRKLSINLTVDRQQHTSSDMSKSSSTSCENKKDYLSVLPPTSNPHLSGTKLLPTIFASNRSRRKSEHAFRTISENDNFKMYGVLDMPLLKSDKVSYTTDQNETITAIPHTEDEYNSLQVPNNVTTLRANVGDKSRVYIDTSTQCNRTLNNTLSVDGTGHEEGKSNCELLKNMVKPNPKYLRPKLPKWSLPQRTILQTNCRLPYSLELFQSAKESYI